MLTLIKLKRPALKKIFKKKIKLRGRGILSQTQKRLQLSFPLQDVCSVHDCSHFSNLASKTQKKKKKPSFFQSHSLVHNRLYSPIALGGLEVPLCKERHREVASIQTHFGGHCARSCLGCRSGSMWSPFCCLAPKRVRGCLRPVRELQH